MQAVSEAREERFDLAVQLYRRELNKKENRTHHVDRCREPSALAKRRVGIACAREFVNCGMATACVYCLVIGGRTLGHRALYSCAG